MTRMRFFLLAFILLTCVKLNAQWDTLNTGTDIRFNAITTDTTMGVVVCGLDPATDSGAFGVLFVSGDNGNTWNERTPLSTDKNREIWDVDYTPDGRVWRIGDSGHVVLQAVWFLNIDCDCTISPYSLRAGYPVGDLTYYCAGEHGVAYRTFDRGLTWDTLSTGTTETINDIYFRDAANGWIIGDGGVLSVTADSGSTWTPVPQPQFGFTDFNGFAYLDSTGAYPYIVGEAGSAQFSIDGGVTWYYAMTSTTQDINKIRFGTPNSGIMVGNGGYILRTENAAFTWTIDASPVGSDLFDVAYASDTTAFICGDNGVVLRSNTDVSSVPQQPVSSFAANAYPNPSTGPLNVNLILQEASDVQIQIVDLTGQVVQNNYYQSVSAGQSALQIGGEELAQGVYFLRISTESGDLTLPIVRD